MAELEPLRFITLEGGEGVGKSTLQRALAERLNSHGFDVITTRELWGTPLAEVVRELALHPPGNESWSAMSEALLMNAARSDHLEKLIRPALRVGKWVICDRFADLDPRLSERERRCINRHPFINGSNSAWRNPAGPDFGA